MDNPLLAVVGNAVVEMRNDMYEVLLVMQRVDRMLTELEDKMKEGKDER